MKFYRAPNDKSEWPTEVFISKVRKLIMEFHLLKDQQSYEDDAIYSWVIKYNTNSSSFGLLFFIILVIALCLFPFWPASIKLPVYYGFVALAIFIVEKLLREVTVSYQPFC
jgi:Preprotein translocase subunit Sec62